jgi:hypothetical protein
MTVRHNEVHANQVDAWEAKNGANIPQAELALLYAKAIQAIQQRSLVSLSSVTVAVVVDRAIHEAKDKYPILAALKPNTSGIDFSLLVKDASGAPEDLKIALRALLIELLNVFGNITADVLTAPLHKELMRVTPNSQLVAPEPQTLRVMTSTKKNREQT